MPNPVIVTTWKFGVPAAQAGIERLMKGATALDAIEAAANITEEDPEVNSVGYGGLPNAEGIVELDAAIMDGTTHAAGAVAGLQQIRRPISVARRVMERTPHVMLVGANAQRFAVGEGFPLADLSTDASRARWQTWQQEQTGTDVSHFDLSPAHQAKKSNSKAEEENDGDITQNPKPSTRFFTPDNHDTIGLVALDSFGNLAVGCTTSGMAWKLPGRVGDPPIIGSGLYVDNEIGGAAGTGHGDEMMKASVSYRVVLLMEQGRTPEEACVEALRYLLKKRPPEHHNNYGAALIAIRKDGLFGAAGTVSGFLAPDRLWQWASAQGSDTTGTPPQAILHEGVYVSPDTVFPSLPTQPS